MDRSCRLAFSTLTVNDTLAVFEVRIGGRRAGIENGPILQGQRAQNRDRRLEVDRVLAELRARSLFIFK